MYKNNRWSLLIWSVFLLGFIITSFLYVSFMIQSHIKNSTNLVGDDIPEYTRNIYIPWDTWVILPEQKETFISSGMTQATVEVLFWWPLEYTILSSGKRGNVTWTSPILSFSWWLLIENFWWLTRYRVKFVNLWNITLPRNYKKITEFIGNVEVTKEVLLEK